MAGYQYGTSPRKLEPRIRNVPNPRKNIPNSQRPKKNIPNSQRSKRAVPNSQKNKKKQEVVKNNQAKNIGISKQEKARRREQVFLVLAVFSLMLMVSYRNSMITEEFKLIQNLKSDLATVEKQNKQLEISLEGSLNLNKIEKIASEQLGMQKRTVEQTIYTELPKEDYVEVTLETNPKQEQNWFQKILNLFK